MSDPDATLSESVSSSAASEDENNSPLAASSIATINEDADD